jgi:hypothetical protein
MKNWGVLPWIFFILAGLSLLSGVKVILNAKALTLPFAFGALFPVLLFGLAGLVIVLLRTRKKP